MKDYSWEEIVTGIIVELTSRIAELERRITILEDQARPRPLTTDHDSCYCSGSCSKAEQAAGPQKANIEPHISVL